MSDENTCSMIAFHYERERSVYSIIIHIIV